MRGSQDADLTDIEAEFETIAIPFVNQAVATLGQLTYRGWAI